MSCIPADKQQQQQHRRHPWHHTGVQRSAAQQLCMPCTLSDVGMHGNPSVRNEAAAHAKGLLQSHLAYSRVEQMRGIGAVINGNFCLCFSSAVGDDDLIVSCAKTQSLHARGDQLPTCMRCNACA